MVFRLEQRQETAVETLLAEFDDHLRLEGYPDFSLLDRCPPDQRKELLSLMNVATLAYRALAPERQAFQARKAKVAK